MANPTSVFGFSVIGTVNGPVNFSMTERKIAAADTTAIGYGDAVVPVTGAATGYVKQATASTVALAGIFLGCRYYSTSQKKIIFNNYWPGSDATGDVIASICADPMALFLCRAGATNVGFAKVGQNIQLNVGTVNTVTGVSGMYAETPGTTATLPFIVVDIKPTDANNDATLGSNLIYVGFNNMIFKAGITGIS